MSSQRSVAVMLEDPALRDTAMSVLRGLGYEPRATDAAGAMAAIEAGILAVVEIGTRGLDPGVLGQARHGRHLRYGSPVVGVIDASPMTLADQAVAAGATSIISKPFDAGSFRQRMLLVERWMRERAELELVLSALPATVQLFDQDRRVLFRNRTPPVSSFDRQLMCDSMDQLPSPLRPALEEALARATESGTNQDIDVRFEDMCGRIQVLPLAGARFALVASDVTEQRRFEDDLRASKVKAEALLAAVPDMVFRMDASGRFLDFRAENEDELAAPPDQIIGHTVADLLPPDVAALIMANIRQALTDGHTQRFEYGLTINGRSHDYEARLFASAREEVHAIVRDITEPKHMQIQLAMADRLAALGTLAAGVAHEINNPLTYILIGIESVLKELRGRVPGDPLGERLPVLLERLAGAMEGARRVRNIVADLRSFARTDEEEHRLIDVRVVLDSAASMADSQVRYRARLVKDYADVPPILGNADRLTQVFLNLLLNAAQAVPEETAADNYVRLRARVEQPGWVVVEVEDSGKGIPGEDLARIFDPFFTTKPVGVGTGLGLWICHSIVSGYGGEISVRSRVGEGTVFRVLLPVARLGQPQGEPADDEAPPLPHGRILVIDDDRQVASSLAILFEGSDVTVVTSGREALERLTAGPDYDWVFCDLLMPDLSGMDLYQQVKRAGRGMERRFVFMTGGAFTPRAREFVATVPNPCVAKPFHPRQVMAALRELAGKAAT